MRQSSLFYGLMCLFIHTAHFTGADRSGQTSFLQLSPSKLSVSNSNDVLFDIRGGAKNRKKSSKKSSGKTVTGKPNVSNKQLQKSKSILSEALQQYNKVLPATRLFMTFVALCTITGLLMGDERTHEVFALDLFRVVFGFQIWRPIFSAGYLGPPSMSWIYILYNLYEYGSQLEAAYGRSQYVLFLVTEVVVLSVLCMLLRIPFFAQAMVTSMLHVLSRAAPRMQVRWVVVKVPYFALPYLMMVSDTLQKQSIGAAVPHLLGILSGHFYHFHKMVWPKTSGEDWLTPPAFLSRLLEPELKAEKTKEEVNKALKSKNKGKGRKLGGK